MDDDVTARADELYDLPLERFVPARDALAKALRADGRRDDASEVAALQKPSVAAWAVNQVVRSQPRAARRLWDAGDAVLRAQADVMAGGRSGADLRAAIDEERAALAPLRDAARGLVTATGRFLGDQNVDQVTETLHAAAVDREVRETVAAGRTARPLRLAGVAGVAGSAAGAAPAGPAAPPTRRAAPSSPDGRRLAERAAADDAAEQERRRTDRARQARRAEAQRALARAEEERERARRRVAEAADVRQAATARLEAAMREIGEAEDELGRAERGLARSHEALERAESTVDAAREDVEQT